jgi:hypothetical protein
MDYRLTIPATGKASRSSTRCARKARHNNERREENNNNNNNNTMDEDDYDDDKVIKYNATRITRNHPVPAFNPVDVPGASQVYYERILETIAQNQLSPLSETQFDEWKGNIEEVLTQISQDVVRSQ